MIGAGGSLRSFSVEELRSGVTARLLVRCRDANATRIDTELQALPGILLTSTGRVEDNSD